MDELVVAALSVLGLSGKDKITGFEGAITSTCFDLYGCVQVVLTPPAKDGKCGDSHWFDLKRVEVDYNKRVFPAPYFASRIPVENQRPEKARRPGDEPGGAAHPPFPTMPLK